MPRHGICESALICESAFSHMTAWTLLARSVLRAEFPEFDLVSAFAVFALPARGQPPSPQAERAVKLERLSHTFNQPTLRAEYEDHLAYAVAAYGKLPPESAYLDGWRAALHATQRIRDVNMAAPRD